MKTQMKFQKILMLVSLVVAALTAVYALIFFSGSFADIANNLEPVELDGVNNDINAQTFYDTAQAFNDVLFIMGIVFIVLAATLFITASHSRRNYYITNYISIIAVTAFAVVFAVYAFIQLSVCLNLFLNDIDWTAWLERYNYNYLEGAPRMYPYYSDSPAMFAIGYVLFFVVLVNAAALVLNLIWKIKLMKGEKALLSGSSIKEAA